MKIIVAALMDGALYMHIQYGMCKIRYMHYVQRAA